MSNFNLSNYLYDFFLCAAGYGIAFYFLNTVLKKRFFTVFPAVITAFATFTIVFVCSDLNAFLKSLISVCVLTAGCFVLFKDKPLEVITYAVLAQYILDITEIIAGGIFSIIFRLNTFKVFEWTVYRMHFSSYARVFDILLFSLIFGKIARGGRTLKNKYRFLFCGIIFAFFLSTNILFLVFTYLNPPTFFFDYRQALMYAVVFSLIFVLTLIVIFFFTEISRGFQRESRLIFLESGYNNLQEQINVRKHNEEQVRKLRHDMQNHLQNIKTLLESGESDSAVRLLEQAAGNLASALPERTFNTGNKFIDAILFSKHAVCQSKGVSFECSVEYSEEIRIDAADLSSLLSNLLDNAIEAASQTDAPFVKISIFKYNAYCAVCVENSYSGFIKHNAAELISTKPDASLHGYGTQIINEIALKYDGNFSWEARENRFIATVLLKI